jgi:hypothetical protein
VVTYCCRALANVIATLRRHALLMRRARMSPSFNSDRTTKALVRPRTAYSGMVRWWAGMCVVAYLLPYACYRDRHGASPCTADAQGRDEPEFQL